MDCFQMSRPVRCIFNYGSQTLTQFNANLILMMLKRFQVDKKKKKSDRYRRICLQTSLVIYDTIDFTLSCDGAEATKCFDQQ